MTPKEKAIKLVEAFWDKITNDDDGDRYDAAKQCALIAVEEIINNINQNLINNTILYNRQLMYWLNVKQEIEKL
jgi:hypothetical protein